MRTDLGVRQLAAAFSGLALIILLAACAPVAPAQPTEPRAPGAVAQPTPVLAEAAERADPVPVPDAAPPQPPAASASQSPASPPDPAPEPAAPVEQAAAASPAPDESPPTVATGAEQVEPSAPAQPTAEPEPIETTGLPIVFTRFQSSDRFAEGTLADVQVSGESLILAPGSTSGTWVSPPLNPGFAFDRLVASWNADTPLDSWIKVEVQAVTSSDAATPWYVMGVWAADDHAVKRTSVEGQSDPLGRIATDTLLARDNPFVAYALRVTLERPAPDHPSPTVRMLGAFVSDGPSPRPDTREPRVGAEGVELPIPRYSQLVHSGHYPQWGGGSVWCSPTSTQMIVEYWGRQPSSNDMSWIPAGHADPSVDFAARGTYDAAYRGTGNWSFNAAYAARFGLDAFVTQLRSLAEAEQFIQAGIPLAASVRVGPGQLDGFLPSSGTVGHLVVVVGFDEAGNPIVNDPLARSNDTVRRVYDRAQFERVWLGGSGGVVYVIHPPEVPLPPKPAGATANW